MNERIKELAEQAGLDMTYPHCIEGNIDDLECFAELVRAEEREAHAKLVEEVGRQTAAAIRAKGGKHD